MNTPIVKSCGRCGRVLALSEFNKDRYTKSGLRSQCRDCMTAERSDRSEYYKEWRQRPSVRAWYRNYRRDGSVSEKIKRDARNAARVLVRLPCEICGNEVAQAHHDDYSKPLDVRWLCTTHHAEWHKHNTPFCPDQCKEIAA